MLSIIPGGRRIKKYVYRMIFGILCLPAAPILLAWNESMAVHHTPVFDLPYPEFIYWGIRLVALVFLWFCFHRIYASVKLFMSKIPLTYQEIRNGIYISSFLSAMIVCTGVIAVCRIYYQPAISLVLAGLAAGLMIALLVRKRQKKQVQKSMVPSAKPHKSKDT